MVAKSTNELNLKVTCNTKNRVTIYKIDEINGIRQGLSLAKSKMTANVLPFCIAPWEASGSCLATAQTRWLPELTATGL